MTVIEVPPRFRVVSDDHATDDRTIVLAKTRAFGDGRHETTRMCLQALGAYAPRRPFRLLDVGSGSGILSIAAAKLGGEAVGVEIDPEAVAAAKDNAERSGVRDRVAFATTWPPDGRFDVVIANILRDVLLELAPTIATRVDGSLVLSGLVSTDVPAVIARYAPLLEGRRPDVFERDAWRTLVWR
ncbi:MAG: 50S ribosomal protein L11 methyltransferase [Labilithrix sp.]|nr:50S ribosomal protein L11 methyltransferase [Labilithrix sp.]MCW5811432.1 50S ribosomal protein L11 methyltransferase [Labilithrix sp.]